MRPAITLSQAMADDQLFGATFASPSFWTWRTVAKLIDGEKLTKREADLARQCTGRSQLPRGPVRRLILLAGRRAGKDRFLSAAAVWRAAMATDWAKFQSAGEQSVVILLGRDKRQAAILRRYCDGLLNVPLLAAEITRRTDDSVEFKNGSSLEISTNNAHLIRGRSSIAILGSECCHWRTDESLSSSDEEVVAAAEPSMAMCPDGGLLLLGSSVYRKTGFMFRKFRELHGNNDAEDICWFAASRVMNPRLPEAVVAKAIAENGPRARAEFENIWREDVSDFLPLDVVNAATDFGVIERPPQPGVHYWAHADAAGGTGQDSFALAICHRQRDDVVVLDAIRERRPRFVPANVIAEYALLLKSYRISEVSGDAYAGGFHAAEWSRNAIVFKPSERTTSENYLAALPMLLSGRGRLLDHAVLRSQLSSLERHATATHEIVSHRAVASAHDDVACAACGAMVLASAAVPSICDLITPAMLAQIRAAPPARGSIGALRLRYGIR